eukprot:TRINITY_DN20630_c0_g1_i1.p3 TRINITY_DN20630_c0_g1~~TRINITY_DN20630_c0_g1_i1.p3  ORF type:complete len:171 (-),score=52.07 TRINITY_DN20630_c0_g1_i1:12-524(-)
MARVTGFLVGLGLGGYGAVVGTQAVFGGRQNTYHMLLMVRDELAEGSERVARLEGEGEGEEADRALLVEVRDWAEVERVNALKRMWNAPWRRLHRMVYGDQDATRNESAGSARDTTQQLPDATQVGSEAPEGDIASSVFPSRGAAVSRPIRTFNVSSRPASDKDGFSAFS